MVVRQLRACWHAIVGWFLDTTDRTVLDSPFMLRQRQAPRILLFSLLRAGAILSISTKYNRLLMLLPPALASLVAILGEGDWPRAPLMAEMLLAISQCIEIFLLLGDASFTMIMVFQVLHLTAAFVLNMHPLYLIILLAPILDMLFERQWIISATGRNLYHHVHGFKTQVITKAWVKVLLYGVGWAFAAVVWYFVSFSRRVYAIKNGQILGARTRASFISQQPTDEATSQARAAGSSSSCCPAWLLDFWLKSTHETVTSSPIMPRSTAFAWTCVIAAWLPHLLFLDIVFAKVGEAAWSCQKDWHFGLVFILPSGCTLLLGTCLLALNTCRRRRDTGSCISSAIASDILLAFLMVTPCMLTVLVMEQIGAQRCLKKQNPGFFESLGRTRGEEQLWFDHVELVELVVAITGGSLLLQRAHPIAVMGASLTNILLLTWIDVRLPRFSVSLKTTFNVMLSTYLNYIPFGLLRWMILVLVCLQLVDYVAVVRGVWASIDRLRENALGLTRLVSARSHGSGGSVELSLRSEEVCETMPSAGQGITEDQPEDGRPGMSLEVMVLPEAIAELREDSRNSRAAGEESPSSLAEDVFHPALAVLRHSHRADTAFDSEWHETDDKMQFPADCPITVEGIREAQGTAEILAESDFGIIICSPYLRCVQTAVILADRLDLFVLLDYEIGEVFGRLVFSEELCRKFQQQGSVPWRSRRELYQALKSWSTEVSELFEDAPATSSRRPLYHRIGWRRILGQPPKCGETLAGARQRYAKRFLTYLARSRKAKRNMILVSHGHFVETALKLLPSTSARDVTAVRYCGGLMARLCRASPKLVVRTASTDFAWDDAGTQSYEIAESPDWEPSTVARKSEDEEERELVDASLPWWDVNVFGIEFGAKSKRNRTERQVQYEAFLKQLHTQKLTWQRLEELLGELPQGMRPATEGRLSCTSATESINDNDTCSSARMFQRNSWETVRTADFTEGDVAAAPVVAPEQAPAAFNLNANSLLSRRPKSMALKLPS